MKTPEERENKINRNRLTIFDIFDFLSFGEEDDVNRTKLTIFEIIDFGEDCDADKQIDVNNIAKTKINSSAIKKRKKQEMINKVLCYQLEKDKAMIYVNTFEQMLQDFKNKDFGDDRSNNEITMNKAMIYINAF